MERFRELEKGFKKNQFSQRKGKLGNYNGKKPLCRKRMIAEDKLPGEEIQGSDDELNDFDYDDEFDHGSDCNCAGSDNDDDDDYQNDINDYGQEKQDDGITTEEANSFLKGAIEFFANQIAKIETEIDKCKKSRGPNMKKMKERQTILGVKVDHARVVKAKIVEIYQNI